MSGKPSSQADSAVRAFSAEAMSVTPAATPTLPARRSNGITSPNGPSRYFWGRPQPGQVAPEGRFGLLSLVQKNQREHLFGSPPRCRVCDDHDRRRYVPRHIKAYGVPFCPLPQR